ncbi:MAG: hypothetical protein RLZZ397_678 [Pseudomonadota bacterium]
MAFSLDSLFRSAGTERSSSADSSRASWRGFKDALAVVWMVLWVIWVLALLSYNTHDAAWSTSGRAEPVRNLLGALGAWVADLSYFAAGYSIWWVAIWCGVQLYHLLKAWFVPENDSAEDGLEVSTGRWRVAQQALGWVLLLLSSCVLEWTRLHRFDSTLPDQAGGLVGEALGVWVQTLLGFNGSALVSFVLMVVSVSWVFGFSWRLAAEKLGMKWLDWRHQRAQRKELEEDARLGQAALRERQEEVKVHLEPVLAASALLDDSVAAQEPLVAEDMVQETPLASAPSVVIEPTLTSIPQSERLAKESQQALFADLQGAQLPQVSLLDKVGSQQDTVSSESLEMTSRLIEKKLKDFGVEVRVVAAAPGPVITRYEIEPATGVKGAQIVNLARDLARSLSLVSIRVIETIPGKNYMALELPNAKRQTIRLSEILGSQAYNEAKSILSMGLGKDIIGAPVVVDLAKMPHCLVAGTTGSGKSVGINAMILSLLYKADPEQVRLLLIDPKMLEMSVYEGIPHLLAPVVTDMKQAANGLNWCVAEMEKRYRLMSKMGVRNISGYNARLHEAKARGEVILNPFSLTPEDPEPLKPLPYIVVVIDELADLMMVVGKKIEELIARLAQKARAAGIHLVLATQRPSVDVITGLIKANIPTRISFQVSSKVDSRTILDQMGAESLLGMGDMLYLPAGTGFPQRVHGAFVSDEEVHRVVTYLKEQSPPNYIEGVLEGGSVEGGSAGMFGGSDAAEGEKDPMYDSAVAVVLKNRKASISLVQRHLKIGYNRAARLLEEMENAGLVSAMSTNGQRDILVPPGQES